MQRKLLGFYALNLGAKPFCNDETYSGCGGKIATIAGSGIFEAGEERWQENTNESEGKMSACLISESHFGCYRWCFGLGFGGAGN